MVTPAIFLDRDGVLNVNRDDHVKCWQEFQFLPGALTAMRMLADLGHPIVVVTNQAIINRGIVTCQTVEAIHRRMQRRIERAGGRVDKVLYCPHTIDEGCDCRKPQPGLLTIAAEELGIDLNNSVFVGDALTDMEAGQRAGCRTVLVRTGRGTDALTTLSNPHDHQPDVVVDDLLSALPAVSDLVGHSESRLAALKLRQQESTYEELTRLEVSTQVADAAFGS